MIKKIEVISRKDIDSFEYDVEKAVDGMQKNGLVVSIQFTTVTDEDGKIVIHTAYITGKEKSRAFDLFINE